LRKHYRLAVAVLSLAPFVQSAAAQQGEIIGDDMYVNCEYRVAAHFPSEPKFRDVTYRDGTLSAPARQFYVEQDKDLLSVTVVNFTNGTDKDENHADTPLTALPRSAQTPVTQSGR